MNTTVDAEKREFLTRLAHNSTCVLCTGGVIQGPAATSLRSIPAMYNSENDTVTIG